MDKNGVLTISDWQKAVAQSPYYGISRMTNCEVFETPGVLKIADKLVNQYSTTGLPIARVQANNGDVYVLVYVSGGTSYLLKNGVSLTNVDGNPYDMVEYKGYLIISTSTGLHCYGTTTATAYFSLWKTGLTSSFYIKLLVGQDSYLYMTNGNYVSRITDFVAGTFSVAPTGTISNALNLKDGQYAVTIQELGRNIMVGTQGGSSWSAIGGQRVANIYPWDRTTGTLGNPGLADLPISFNECGIHAMLTVNNIMYVVAGTRGNVYKTDGTSSVKIGRIPWTQSRNATYGVWTYPNAIFLNANGNLLVGLSVYSGSVTDTGVWEINIPGSNEMTLKHLKESSTIGLISGDALDTTYVGWSTSLTTFGLDYTPGIAYSDYSAVAESQVYLVGDADTKKTFQFLEFSFGKPLTNNQGIKIYYRKNTQADYTLIGTYTYAEIPNVISRKITPGIADAQMVQIKVALYQDDQASQPPQWELELVKVKLW